MTRGYEALIILKAARSEQDATQSAAKLEEPIKQLGGRVESSQGWGRRKLAFRIARHTEGYYHLVRFTAPTERLAELKRLYRLNEAIVRFLILSEDEVRRPPSSTS